MEKVEQTYKLPEGWTEVEIKDISLKLNYGYTAKSIINNTGTKFLRITDIQENYVYWTTVPYCEIDEFDKPKYVLNKGDIVFARTGATVGKSYLIGDNVPDAVFASYLIRIQLSQYIDPKFVFYYFQSGEYWKQIGVKTLGVGQPHVNANSLSKLKLPLPSKFHQESIVSKIETLFSELDHAEKNLQETKQQLETYRQGLLKKAFNGELSKKWRSENLEEHKKIGNELPANWKYIKITSLSDFVGSGSTPKGGRSIYIEDGIPFIRSQNVLVNRLIEDDLVFISPEIHEKMKRTHTKPKDVLLNITGASIGRCAYIHEGFIEGNVNQHVCIIRVNHKMIDYKYITFFLNSPEAQLRIKQINTGATREALTLSQIKAFEIPVCDMREQNIITQTLESQFTLIDNLNDTINKSIEEVVSLRHSILKKAFDGNLVNQEPTDEPVQKLLELIKKEKIEYLKSQKDTLLQEPKRILQMDSNKTVWQILSSTKIAMRTDKLWSESKHKDDIDAFYAEVKELIDSGKIVEDKRQGKISYLKIK